MKNILKSFKFAFEGLKILLQEEQNARIHLLIMLVVIIAGFVYNISYLEWVAIIFAIGLVFALEILNTAIENLADFVSPDKHQKIKKIKDLCAAAVLTGAITALIIGGLIFLPKIFATA
jgi:diacylglycerol kinase